jgi:glycosyltransferase involved in cell wall biosynthesis
MEGKQRLLVIGPRGIDGHEGGVEKFAEEFVRYAHSSAKIAVLTLGRVVKSDAPVELICAPRSRCLSTDKAYYIFYALSRVIFGRYDRILILGINFAMLVPLAKILYGSRVVVVVRSGSIDYLSNKWGRWMSLLLKQSERLSRYADSVVAVSPSVQRHLATRGVFAKVIRNGLEQRQVSEYLNRDGTVLAVGRLTPAKNYRALIEAAALLGDRCPPIVIVGGGDHSPEANSLMRLAEYHKATRVTFAGRKSRGEVLGMLRMASLFVNCSVSEGMANAVLEAIQERTPLILSDIEANRDLGFEDRFYFSPTSSVDLAKKMLEALNQPRQFLASPTRFDDWRTAVDRFCGVLQIPGVGVQPSRQPYENTYKRMAG